MTLQRFGGFTGYVRAVLWTAGCCYLLGTASRGVVPTEAPRPIPQLVCGVKSQAGHPLGGRLWTHVDREEGGRIKFRMYQFNPAGNDGGGTGWYHEGDFTEWMTEVLRYRIEGDHLVLYFELAREKVKVPFKIEKARGPDGEDLKFTLMPDPRRYWKKFEYYASSKQQRGASLPGGEALPPAP